MLYLFERNGLHLFSCQILATEIFSKTKIHATIFPPGGNIHATGGFFHATQPSHLSSRICRIRRARIAGTFLFCATCVRSLGSCHHASCSAVRATVSPWEQHKLNMYCIFPAQALASTPATCSPYTLSSYRALLRKRRAWHHSGASSPRADALNASANTPLCCSYHCPDRTATLESPCL